MVAMPSVYHKVSHIGPFHGPSRKSWPLYGPRVPPPVRDADGAGDEFVCENCSELFKSRRRSRFCSKRCRDAERTNRSDGGRTVARRRCLMCHEWFNVTHNARHAVHCSMSCSKVEYGPKLTEVRVMWESFPCESCGIDVERRSMNQKRCSECSRRNNSDRSLGLYYLWQGMGSKPGEMRIAMRWRQDIIDELRRLDGDDCWICHGKRGPLNFHTGTGPTGGDDHGATIDHIKPRSKGGADEWGNLQLAHWCCNREKKDREGFSIVA